MKFLNKKRIASAALAGALALSMAAPAFASSNSVITGNYKEVRLAVTVPTTGKAVINPYGLPIALSEKYSISGQGISNAAPLTVQNRSAVPLKVNASITSAKTGNFAFETNTAIADNETGNKGLVKFEMFPAPALTETTLENEDVLIGGFAALDSANALPAGGVQLMGVAGTPDAATNILTLREGSADGSLQAGGAAYFRLTGEAVKAPTTPWAADDGFTATIAFTFEPTSEFVLNAGTITGTANAIGTPASALKLTLDKDLPANTALTTANTTWELTGTNAAKFKLTAGATADEIKVGINTLDAPTSGDKVTLKVTVTVDGVKYVSEIECTAA